MIPSGYTLFSPRKKKGKIQQAKGAMYANKRLRSSRRRRKISSSKDQYQVTSYGMEQSKTDPCVFVKYDQNSETEVMAVSTDDVLVASEQEHWQKLAAFLSHDYQGRFQTYQLDINKACTNFNGIEMKREDANKYFINFNTYTKVILKEGVVDVKNAEHYQDLFKFTKEHDKQLMSRIIGSASNATKYRDHIIKIIKDNYTNENIVSDVPNADKLLELVY